MGQPLPKYRSTQQLDGGAATLAVSHIGRVKIVYQNLLADARGSYSAAKAALLKSFNQERRRGLYPAEFQTRQTQLQEDWASFSEDLKHLVNKAFPDIEESARKRMAVDRFLLQLEDPQLTFRVRQKRQSNMDEAVTYTLSLSSRGPAAGEVVTRTRDSAIFCSSWCSEWKNWRQAFL
jgi:hypothetical protein